MPITFSPARTITVPVRAGSREVTAADASTPGLVVHEAVGTGWSLTHEPSGRCVARWPRGTPEQVLVCAAALGQLADWTTTDLSRLTLRPVWRTILDHGGWAPTGDPARAGSPGTVWLRSRSPRAGADERQTGGSGGRAPGRCTTGRPGVPLTGAAWDR
jgi:hypothetical protein